VLDLVEAIGVFEIFHKILNFIIQNFKYTGCAFLSLDIIYSAGVHGMCCADLAEVGKSLQKEALFTCVLRLSAHQKLDLLETTC
jgi:hypothetical protein